MIGKKENIYIKENSGRTMIEMLGVLAIVAVISLGSLVGYTRAIIRYRTNQTIEQVFFMVTNIRSFFANSGVYSSFNIPTAVKYNLVTQNMIGKGSILLSPFRGNVVITTDKAQKNDINDTAFVITYKNLPSEVCVTLATMDWGIERNGGFIGVSVGSGEGGAVYPKKPSEYFVSNEQQRVLTVDEVTEPCAGANPDVADSVVSWKYY